MTKAVCAHSFFKHATINPLCPSLPTWRKVVNVAILAFEAMYIYAFYQHCRGEFQVSRLIISSTQNSILFRIISIAFVSLFTPFYNVYAFFTKTGPSPFQLKYDAYLNKMDKFEENFVNQTWSHWDDPNSGQKFLDIFNTLNDLILSCPTNDSSEALKTNIVHLFIFYYHAFRQGNIICGEKEKLRRFKNPYISENYHEKFYQTGTVHCKSRELFNNSINHLARFNNLEISKLLKTQDLDPASYNKSCAPQTPAQVIEFVKQEIANCSEAPEIFSFKNKEHLPSENKIHALGDLCKEKTTSFETTLKVQLSFAKEGQSMSKIWEDVSNSQTALEILCYNHTLAKWALEDFAKTLSEEIKSDEFSIRIQKSYALGVIMNFVMLYHYFRQAANLKEDKDQRLKYTTPQNIPQEHSDKFYQEGTYHSAARTLFNQFIEEFAKVPGTEKFANHSKFKQDVDKDSYSRSKPILK